MSENARTDRALAGTPIDAAALSRRAVSYRDLRAAGVDAGAAARLRRTHSLVWDFRWRAGESDLRERAREVRGLRAAEREWVAASDPRTCRRCGGELVTYELNGRETTACEDCGRAGVSVDHTAERCESEGWARATRRFREE